MAIDYTDFPSPCFVLDETRLRANLEQLDFIQRESGATILCALKGFAFFHSFPLVRRYLTGVTASSLHEAQLGQQEFRGQVHTYCPAYLPHDFPQLSKIASHLTFNSLSEFERYQAVLQPHNSAGLRINPEYAEVETALYNPCMPGSRLGVTAKQLRDVGLPGAIEGLHLHSLCEQGADTLERTIEVMESRFAPFLDQIRWINLGGGHAITRNGYDQRHLIAQLRALRARHPNLEQVLLEPGSAVGWQCGELVSRVLDIVRNADTHTAMLDVSFAAHMPDCLEMPYQPELLGASTTPLPSAAYRYHLGGQSCLAGDFIADYYFERPLKVGDPVIFEDMMHYTMVKTTTFNGIALPSIAVIREDGSHEVLSQFSYDDYKRRI